MGAFLLLLCLLVVGLYAEALVCIASFGDGARTLVSLGQGISLSVFVVALLSTSGFVLRRNRSFETWLAMLLSAVFIAAPLLVGRGLLGFRLPR